VSAERYVSVAQSKRNSAGKPEAMRKDGTNGPDQLIGTPDNDVLNGLGGNDTNGG